MTGEAGMLHGDEAEPTQHGEGAVVVPREPTEGHDGAVLATDLALLNALVYTHGGDAALAGWVRIVRALSAAPKPQPASQGEGVSAEEHRQRGVRLVGMTEWAGAHLCRAEKAEAALKAHEDHAERIADTVKETGGYWSPCSGCYDTEDGHPTAAYPHSTLFGCEIGSGCSDCGGLGAQWDDLSYVDDMVLDHLTDAEVAALSPQPAPGEAVAASDRDIPDEYRQAIRAANATTDDEIWTTTPAGQSSDDAFTFAFVEALAKETFAQKYGPSVWNDANETLRRYWISRTQDAIQRARHALSTQPSSPGEA